jgi:hypothetical protein
MTLTFQQSRVCTALADVLHSFLPASGKREWKGHITFHTVASDTGVGHLWYPGSKLPAVTALLERTLDQRPERFQALVLRIVTEGIRYRIRKGEPVRRSEIEAINQALLGLSLKLPQLWDSGFLDSLDSGSEAPVVAPTVVLDPLEEGKVSIRARGLEHLKKAFYALANQPNRHEAGYSLEKLLRQLLDLFGLHPRSSYRVPGEQIDVSFELDTHIYLLESKWVKEKVGLHDLLFFREKVEGKSAITRGLFVAINGFQPEAVDALKRGRQPNMLLMDGTDLAAVLEGAIPLDELLRAKLRHMAEEGESLLSVTALLAR